GRLVRWSGVGKRDDQGAAALVTASQIDALAEMLAQIEAMYGAPQDVEWCHDGRQFWIVQSRPVTTGRVAIGSPLSSGTDHQPPITPIPNPQSPIPNPANVEWT